MAIVILSDQQPLEVRQLGIFELDTLRPKPLGPFTYKMEIMGKEYDAVFNPLDYDTPPEKPEIPEHEAVPHSKEWYAWSDYKLYHAAIDHQGKRHEMAGAFVETVAAFIFDNCIAPEDLGRIVTDEDWDKLYEAALVPQLTTEVLAQTLEKTYQAEFEGQDVLSAMQSLKSDQGGAYDTLRLWENELMVHMNLTELEYAMLPLAERARKVVAMNLPKIMEGLEYHRREHQGGKEPDIQK